MVGKKNTIHGGCQLLGWAYPVEGNKQPDLDGDLQGTHQPSTKMWANGGLVNKGRAFIRL